MRTLSPLAIIGSALFLVFVCALSAHAESPCCEELTLQLKQQGERIDRLEEALRSRQAQGVDARQGHAAPRSLDDPLVGTWECTNKVFTYNMTFFADGLLLQESTTFGPMRELSWTRVSADEILFTGGVKMRASFSAADRFIAENLATRAKWECQKLPN